MKYQIFVCLALLACLLSASKMKIRDRALYTVGKLKKGMHELSVRAAVETFIDKTSPLYHGLLVLIFSLERASSFINPAVSLQEGVAQPDNMGAPSGNFQV